MNMSRAKLRQIMRTRRRAVSTTIAQTAAKQLATNVLNLSVVQNSQHIAGFIANDGEISPAYLAEGLQSLGKSYYLPVLDRERTNHLIFVRYQVGDGLKLNRYKIPEPDILVDRQQTPWQLDIVLMPLVAFDEHGCRLGMGGGFYDRTFEFIQSSAAHKPLLIGLAYEFQRVELLESKPWDVPLDRVVTEQNIYKYNV